MKVRKSSGRSQPKKQSNTPKKKKKAKTFGGVSPSFAALPGAPMRIPSALLEGRRGSSVVKPSSPPKAVRKQPVLAVERLIAGLPQRTMGELQQQWRNVLVKIDGRSANAKALRRFRQAIIDEWGRRFRLALADPDYFDWPSTDAAPCGASKPPSKWHTEGVLGYLGYHVGVVQGVSEGVRRQILDTVFSQCLPPVNGPDYCREWARPGAAARLERLAIEIARFVKNAKGKRSADMTSAIAEWEHDLKYLHREYYVGKFGFGWPSIE